MKMFSCVDELRLKDDEVQNGILIRKNVYSQKEKSCASHNFLYDVWLFKPANYRVGDLMKMTKMRWSLGIVLVATLVLLFVSLGNARKSYRVVCDIWPPYQVDEADTVTGFSTEIVRAVFQNMDLELEHITAYPWKRALSAVEEGYADALFSANYTADRTLFARYPQEELVMSPWIIWTQKGSSIRTMEDLKDKRIGVVLGYSYTPEFWEYIETYCDVERVFSDKSNFMKLSLGRLDAVAAEYGNGMHLVRSLGLGTIQPKLDMEIKRDGLYIIFNRKNITEDFVQEFSAQLRDFKKSDQYWAIREKYFGSEVAP